MGVQVRGWLSQTQTAFMGLVPRKEIEEKVKVKIPRHEGTHMLSQHLEIKEGEVSVSESALAT